MPICCSATAFGTSRSGTNSATHDCRAGPVKANDAPLSSVDAKSKGTVIRSVAISAPVPVITSTVVYCPASTIGFLGKRSAITPPNGVRNSIPTPLPIAAKPDAA